MCFMTQLHIEYYTFLVITVFMCTPLECKSYIYDGITKINCDFLSPNEITCYR